MWNTITQSRANYSSAGYSYDLTFTSTGYRGLHPDFAAFVGASTSPVGWFPAGVNGYGLYDMAGNAGEWCWDVYGPYSSGTQTDPRGPTSYGDRLLRGGHWYAEAVACRVAFRNHMAPFLGGIAFGFRSVLPPGQP